MSCLAFSYIIQHEGVSMSRTTYMTKTSSASDVSFDKTMAYASTCLCFCCQVCNHPELFERNEGSSYLYFGVINNSLLPPPFGEQEDVHYSGGQNPIKFEVQFNILKKLQVENIL